MDSDEKIYTSMVGDQAGGTPVFVHVKEGRIIRVRPMIFNDDEAKPWVIKVGNKSFSGPKKANGGPWDMSIRRRVGYEPGGKGNTDSRGSSEFVRISWNEALDIATNELKRMRDTYGNSAILSIASGHASTGMLNGHAVTRRAWKEELP